MIVLVSLLLAQGITPLHCPAGVTGIAQCPLQGCGDVSDAFLNLAKNKTATPASPRAMTVAAMKALPQPATWLTGKVRTTVTGAGKEGTPVVVIGFLSQAKAEKGESCNCELVGPADTDVHLVIVDKAADPETASVTAELTPRLRGQHPNWNAAKINADVAGKLVRLTGFLMLDTAHLPHPQLVSVQDGGATVTEHQRGPLKRATNWEVHPVTKLEVCTGTEAACRGGQGWKVF